jgi:hypothetical protein
VLSQEPDLLNPVTNTNRAMWERKYPSGQNLPKLQNLTMNPITSEIEDSINNLPDKIWEDCIMVVKNKRNLYFGSNNNQGTKLLQNVLK